MQEKLAARISSSEQVKPPIAVRFDPPAFLQRRAFVLETLRSLEPKCKSLLDVGTGDGGLLSFLVRCDDDLPISIMVGIDPDCNEIALACANTIPTRIHHEDLRWRPLEIALYQGGVADLKGVPGSFDCITAIEVLEHLDPADVEALTQICLGQLRPRCFIVTTPNRDFNRVFARLRQNPKHVHRRAGIEYVMRHSDHRFEMSRNEFQAWATAQCKLHDYQVMFRGIGTMDNAFDGQGKWRDIFPEDDLSHAFGCSSQAAIFTSRPELSHERESSSAVKNASACENLHLAAKHTYPWTDCDDYPPTVESVKHIVARAEAYFRPLYDSTRNYGHDTQIETVIECKQFFDTCYDVQRASRYHLEVFLTCVSTMLGQEIPNDMIDIHVQSASASSREFEHEPVAVFARAQFRAGGAASGIALVYTFDISSFSDVRPSNDVLVDSLDNQNDSNWSQSDALTEPIGWQPI